MSTFIPTNNGGSGFVPHPAGRTLGVCADVYILERLNNFFGKPDRDGRIDKYRTRTVVRFAWLTAVPAADGKPSYVSQEFTASDNERSNLYKFLVSWHPEVSGKKMSEIDMDTFVGSGSDLVVTNKPSKDGRSIYANVVMCVAPREGDVIPQIPSDFKRADVRKKQEWEDKAINKVFPDFQIRYAEERPGAALSPAVQQAQRPAPAGGNAAGVATGARPVFGAASVQTNVPSQTTNAGVVDNATAVDDDLPF